MSIRAACSAGTTEPREVRPVFNVQLPDGRTVSTSDFVDFCVSRRGEPLGSAFADEASGMLIGPAWVVALVRSSEVWDALTAQSDAALAGVSGGRAESARRHALN